MKIRTHRETGKKRKKMETFSLHIAKKKKKNYNNYCNLFAYFVFALQVAI